MPSFDIVSQVNAQEVKNAVEQASKEIQNRFDFKGSDARIEQAEAALAVYADDDFKLKQVMDVFQRTGLYQSLGAERFFRTEEQVLDHVWKKLGNNHEVDCPLNIVCPVTPAK